MEGSRLHQRFVRYCEIRSPTGEERAIADTLAAELQAMGLEVGEDDAAQFAQAGAGNLIARSPGTGDGWLMLCAHMDTVPHRGQIEVVSDEGVFRSRGDTILGADNKAAVAVFMELVARHLERPAPMGIELVLTVAEEQGLRGAKAFDTSQLRSQVGFVLDHAGAIGEVIVSTPTQQKILADFIGVEAHAGIKPEDGNNAIAAAAAAISRMELGRLDEGTTANVGLISGGTSGNVIPGHCAIHAEARSLETERAAEVAGRIADACAWGASEHGCDVDVRIEELFRGYKVPKDSAALALAEDGLRGAGLEPQRVAIGGGSDANVFRRHGFDCVLLSNGTDAVHTSAEIVPARSLDKMLEVCEGILESGFVGGGTGVSGRLKLRRGVVISAEPLLVEVEGERRQAWADEALLGEMRAGDEVVVNVAALDLNLGSGGFDVVHVNLTRGLTDGDEGDAHVMKLNYTSLQHPVEPVEGNSNGAPAPVLVLPLHGHLAPAAWAAAQASPGLRVGYVQTAGGALPGSLSRDVNQLRERGLLAGHITAAPSYGGEYEALSTVGAIAAAGDLGWGAVIVGPGPGIIGSNTEFGHGGMAALESAHAALSLRCPTIISPRLSSSDPRERHLHLSHHTFTVLELLLSEVDVAVPEADLPGAPEAKRYLTEAAGGRHRLRSFPVDLGGYREASLPTKTMGRSLEDDPLFFSAPLAAGTHLARVAS